MEQYRDKVYLNLIRRLNTEKQEIMKDDLGSQFVRNCGRDLAGEVVRNCFNTSNYYLTVDQLAKRILEFSYENEYDPLAQNGGAGELTKLVYNYHSTSAELEQVTRVMEDSQKQLFTNDRKQDKLDINGKKAYRKSVTGADGTVYDDLTGKAGGTTPYIMNGKVHTRSDIHADHIQAREAAMYNSRYLKTTGVDELKLFWNSSENMQMMFASANSSKGDVRVCSINGKIVYLKADSNEYKQADVQDITYRATPEELADAVCFRWESVDPSKEGQNQKKIQNLKDKGYLNEDGKVPKSVRSQLVRNIRASQNAESRVTLKSTNYGQVSLDAFSQTKGGIGEIIAGQIIYYAAPPIVYELRMMLKDKDMRLENALEKLEAAQSRIEEYVFSKLKQIFTNILVNSLKRFIKSFMDILIKTVKATVQKLLKMAKNLVLSTVDAIRIISNKQSTSAEKADAVFNLYGVTITACVVELLFDLAAEALHIPPPLDGIVFGPLQILTSIICTNLTLLILKKLDLFDVQYGFKRNRIKMIFEESTTEYDQLMDVAQTYTDRENEMLIEAARQECQEIYENLQALNYHSQSARNDLEKINTMFSMEINFEEDWLRFLGFVPA